MIKHFPVWWTTREWARDKRTGTHALVTDTIHGWQWILSNGEGVVSSGLAKTRQGARTACRNAIRKIAGAPTK